MFLVHLSLKFRHRHDQLRHLHELVKRASKPVIVAGDFNTFWGEHEISLFMEATGCAERQPRWPAVLSEPQPAQELDFVLYSNGIEVTQFDVPDVRFSDHRPLICDFHVRAQRRHEQGTTTHWRSKPIDADVAWLTLDKAGASANTLSRDVMEELDAMLDCELEAAAARR